jgi:peroxin-1
MYQHTDSFRNRHLAESFISIFTGRGSALPPGVVIIATARNQAALHPAFATAHVFKKVLSLHPPDKDARTQVILCLASFICAWL